MCALTIFHTTRTANAGVRLSKLAEWSGVPSQAVALDDIGMASVPAEVFTDADSTVAITADALTYLHENSAAFGPNLLDAGEVRCQLLIYGFEGTEREGSAVSWLTGCLVHVSRTEAPGKAIVSFPVEGQELSRELAGTEFVSPQSRAVAVFERTQGGSEFVDIARTNGRPIFIQAVTKEPKLCLLGGAKIADIDTPIVDPRDLDCYYDRVIPVLMFLKASFGPRTWHSKKPVARLIIDDPVLSDQYGYLNYAELQASMARADYATTIAFIPWNFWRTSKAAVKRLLLKSPRLSLCIHGCDHTNQEFAEGDQSVLARKAKLAMRRMFRHEARTGARFEPIMVFPQGKFSTGALKALEQNGYLAAANSAYFPWGNEGAAILLGNLLLPAVTRWGGFPIFPRQYPDQQFQCALALFLGRPLLLVEHHQYFKNGYGATEQCIAELRRREPSLAFLPLQEIVEEACLVRRPSPTVADVRFFTRSFQFAVEDQSISLLRFRKHEPDPSRVSRVLVDGRPVPFRIVDPLLQFEITVQGAPRTLRIEVELAPAAQAHVFRRPGLRYECGVLMRRFSSEFRDQVLCRNETLLRFASAVVRKAGLTGEAVAPPNAVALKASSRLTRPSS